MYVGYDEAGTRTSAVTANPRRVTY
jgi:hypothetical protein